MVGKGGKGEAPERIGDERPGKGKGAYQKMGEKGHRTMTFSAAKQSGR